MRDLVRGPVERLVHVVLADTEDEEVLGEGDEVRVRAAVASVGRVLRNAQVGVRIGAELLGEVVERRLHAVHRAVQAAGVCRVVEDAQLHVIPLVLEHVVPG
jgi:hypothetical protein